MFRSRNSPSHPKLSGLQILIAVGALMACPGVIAQRGAGGGHVGGGTAGGSGLTGGSGIDSGLDVKDDLKDFHAALAVQATAEQISQYNAMLKSTELANSGLQAFQNRPDAESSNSNLGNGVLANRDVLISSINEARKQNAGFLAGFSEQQKSGLKETIKKLIKIDSELAQQAVVFQQQASDAKGGKQQISGSSQNLQHVLENFRSAQIALGAEMSIAFPGTHQDLAITIAPVNNSLTFAGQVVSITTTGEITRDAAQAVQNTFKLELISDLSDLQNSIAQFLRARIDKSNRCGERIAIQNASLTPTAPASVIVANVHYERWACFGGNTINEMAEGDGTIEVKLTPAIAPDGTLSLEPKIVRVDAEGLVGELLRSGSLGEVLRDQFADAVLSTVPGGSNYSTVLPPSTKGEVTLHRATFQGTGLGKLSIVVDGELRVTPEQVSLLTGQSGASATKVSGAPATPPAGAAKSDDPTDRGGKLVIVPQ